MAQENEGLE